MALKVGPVVVLRRSKVGGAYVRLADGRERWIPGDWLEDTDTDEKDD